MQTNQATKMFLPWFLVTTLSIGIGDTIGARTGEIIGFPLGDRVEQTLQGMGLNMSAGYVPSIIAGSVNGLVAGFLIGLLQWLLLRNRVKHAGWWVPLTMVGGAISSLVASGILQFFITALGGTWFGLLVGFVASGFVRGLCIGLLQWLVFAGRFEGSFWWIVGSLCAWTLGDVLFAVAYSTLMIFGEVHRLWETVLSLMSGLLVGAITGMVLAYLFGHPSSNVKENEGPYAHI